MVTLARYQQTLEAVPRIAKSDMTRSAILDAALEYLWTRPFRDMTVAKLAASLDISRPTFYQYFPSIHGLMETLLLDLENEILGRARPWFTGAGDVRQLLHESLAGLVDVCFEWGPILRAVADAAPNDPELEAIWHAFLERLDDAVTNRIEADQSLGLIPDIDARGIAVSFNRMDAYTLIHAFGRHPRKDPGSVLAPIVQIWTSTLYPGKRVRKRRP